MTVEVADAIKAERAAIADYVRLVGSRHLAYGMPEKFGMDACIAKCEAYRALADDIEDGAHYDER